MGNKENSTPKTRKKAMVYPMARITKKAHSSRQSLRRTKRGASIRIMALRLLSPGIFEKWKETQQAYEKTI